MSCGEQCLSGFIHQGTPSGTFTTCDQIRVYVASPSNPIPGKAMLIYPDIYGVDLINTKLIADRLAKDLNLSTYLIDTFFGDSMPEPGTPGAPDLAVWLKGHGPEKTLPILEKVIKHLTEKGIERFAAVGFCFGGKYVMTTSQKNWIHVAVASHPSLWKIPEDLHLLLENSQVPLLVNSCETDQQYPIESQKITDEVLGDDKYKPGYKRTYYPGATHGFGCRADLNNPAEKFAFDDSYKETVNWIKSRI